MKTLTLASRNLKEIVRDPLNAAFGIGFPVALMLLLTAIQANVPVSLFELEKLTPGIAVFGLSFFTLFAATLVSRDRGSDLLQRLYTAPLSAADFIFGYTLPVIPLAAAQTLLCYLLATVLGMKFSVNVIFAILLTVPCALFFIFLGLFCGSVLNDKQVGGICGALLTNLCAWLSGAWFDLDLVGGAFKKIAGALPFYHVTELGRAALRGDFREVPSHLLWALGYGAAAALLAVVFFTRQMKKQ